MSEGMHPLRLFSKLSAPKKLDYESFDGRESSVAGDDASEPSSPQLPAFVTTRREAVLDLSPPRSSNAGGGGQLGEFDLSPPKTISRGRKRNQAHSEVADGAPEAARNEHPAAQTPGRSKRKTKLTWQSRQAPETPGNAHHRRSPSLTRIQSDNCRLDAAPDPATSRNLQQSASFSGLSAKEGWNNSRSAHKGGGDNVISTPRGSRNGNGRPPMNTELNSSVTSLGSVNSVATPRSASRTCRYGGASSTATSLAGMGLASTRATGANAARMFVQAQQQASHVATEQHFELEEDPTFWQDHNVQVLIRTRPMSSSEIAQQGYGRCVKQENAHTVAWLGQPETRFTFDHVAGESISQEELFRVAGLPMVENCMAGYNSCMFAYGQTGSGKTHTMLGDIADLDHQPSDNRGMTPRVFESLFAKIRMEEEAQKYEKLEFKCRCSFLEIYNEQIADLLEPSSSNLQMREDATKGVYVEGLLEVEVLNVQDVVHLLLLGSANRRVAATNMNRESSRSHSVFTCIIESQWECDSMINFRFGRLNLVDLAGSERQKASGAEGERLKEAASINKSLSTLGLVIMVLVDVANGKQRHVPYRDSKLTFLLQDSLGGNSKTTIIANISPSSCGSSETLSTLKFAQRAKFIRNNAIINEDTDGDINGLRQQIQQLKDELARLRRQSISRIPTLRASGTIRGGVIDEESPSNSKDGLDPPTCLNEGSFLQFGRALLSPTVLNKKIRALEAVLAGALRREQAADFSTKRSAAEIDHLTRLVKQREDEAQCSKLILRFREDKIRRLEALSEGVVSTDTYLSEEKDAALEELQLLRDQKGCNPELTRFAVENIRLQEQLRRFQDYDTGGEREAMAQEISNLREQLVEMLDSKLSLDSLAHFQRDASAAKLAAERRQLELLSIEVDSYQRDLEECRTNLSICLESNEKMASQLDELRAELDSANEECSKHKQELEKLQEKALEVDYLELKQAQHQQFMFELKTQLKKSEEKAEQEASRRSQIEQQLKEALQESTNLQTELQWTKDSLDAAEALVETLQQNDLSSEMGVDQCREAGLNQAHVIVQLQLELVEIKTTLENERVRGRGLEEQIADHGKEESKRRNAHKRVESSESYDSAGHIRVRHHDAILQLQMELDTIDGAPESAIKSYRWEEGTRDEDVNDEAEVKHSVTIMQLQLDLESAESALEEERRCLKEVEASNARLQKQLEETVSQLSAQKEIVGALEGHQTSIVDELELLRADYQVAKERLSKREGKDKELKQRIAQLEWELTKEQELRSIEREVKEQTERGFMDEAGKSALQAKLKRAKVELQKAQNLNFRIRGEQASRAALEQEMEATRSEAELEISLGFTSMQSELLELRDEVAGAMEREAAAREDVARLSQELASLNVILRDVQEEYDRLLKEKHTQICAIQRDWEGAAARLIDYLAAGELSVDAASSQTTEELFGTSLFLGKKVASDKLVREVVERQKAVESLKKQLQDARKLASSSESKLQEWCDSTLDETHMHCMEGLYGDGRESLLQAYQNTKVLKMEVKSCDAKLREIERKSTAAFIMVWWLSETAGLRRVAEDRMRVELTEAVAKIQEREGVLFSLQLEREKTPEKESRSIQLEALRVRGELAAWEEERIQLAAKKEKFEIQVRESAKMLEDLHGELGTAERRLRQVDNKASQVAKVQAGLAVAKENWKLEKTALVAAAAEAEQRYMRVKGELSATQNELNELETRIHEAEAREHAVQAERAKLEEELKKHLEAVQVLADALQNQIEMKEEENLKLKEQMAEQYEDWVLERSDLLVAAREAEARCMEKNQTITNMQRALASLQGHVSAASYEARTLDSKMYDLKDLPEDEARLQLEERVEEMTEAMDRLTAENMDLQRERQLLVNDMDNARNYITQKKEEFAAVEKRLVDAEEQRKQSETKLEALTLLMDQFACSEGNWLSERESLRAEIERLQSCMATMERDCRSRQEGRDECATRLAAVQKNMEVVEIAIGNAATKDSKHVEVQLAKALAALAGSEEKVKLLTEMVATMGEDWAAEREKEDLQLELSRWEQHTDVRRSTDQPLRNLSENRSVSAADGSTNPKHMDKLRQDVERMRTETGKLRTKVREKDHVILSVRMELSAALTNRKELEVEMEKMEKMLQAESELQTQVMKELQTAEGEISRHQGHVQKCESELERLTMLLLETEERMNEAEQKWREEKAQLETAREQAELEASEKKNEAAAMLVKFEEWKTTLREADLLVNALVQANEKAKQRWKREKDRLAKAQAEETKQVMLEMLETVALTKEQVDMTMGHVEGEMRALVAETQMLKMEMTTEILKLKREKPGSIDETSRSLEMLPSFKCLDSERRSWEQQFKAATTVLTEKEVAIRSLQAELDKTRKQTVIVQTAQSETLKVLQEKEEMVMKLVNELNHLNQNVNRDRSLRQSLTRDTDGYTSLRRSFSCKLIEEKETTLSVLKEEQENLKTMVFGLETENAELQQQLLEAEAKATAMESTIGILRSEIQDSNERRGEEVATLAEQLKESTRHISELECHRMELRDEMQRQAVSFAELYEQLQKQEGALEGEARTIASKVAEEKEVLQTLEEEKAELKCMVERLDAELTVYEKKAATAETSQAELERLRLEMEGLQHELLRIESLQKEIDTQNAMLDTMSEQRTKLEADLALKKKELSLIGEELDATRASADLAAQEREELRTQVYELQEKARALEDDLTRKRCAIKALESELLTVEETMARCLEEATVDLKELETERDKLQTELLVLSEQLEMTQALADERAAVAAEARQIAELSKSHAEEKQVEAEILGRSVEELESTVYALESQLGILKRESERQRLMREDMEMELQGLKNHMSIMQAALDEAGARSADELLEAQAAREDAERRLDEKEAEMQLAHSKLEKLRSDLHEKSEKIRYSKAEMSDLLAESEKKAAEYEQKLKAVEIKLEERVTSHATTPKGSKVKGTGSTFKCIGMGHQVHSELDEERKSYECRIQELETALSNRQKEVCILNGKLAGAERMTRDVLQDLLGVKSDMTNVATLLGQQQVEQESERSQRGALEKDEEVEHLLSQLNEFIEERESWLEEISRRQADLSTSQVAVEKLREHEKTLVAENDKTKSENRMQQKKIGDLEQEVKKLSGQQNLQQRIKHHAKIKDENNSLRIQNDELSGKLRRAELLYARVSDELAKYRVAEGKTPLLNIDEEQRLRNKLQEAEEQNIQAAQKLVSLCTSVLKAAGISNTDSGAEPAVALEALQQLRNRLESTQLELEDCKLKIRIAGEKQRLNVLRTVHSPMKGIGNFSAQSLAPR